MAKRFLATLLGRLLAGRVFTFSAGAVLLGCGVLGANAAMSMIRSGVLVVTVTSPALDAAIQPPDAVGAVPFATAAPAMETAVAVGASPPGAAKPRQPATPLIGRATACAIASYRLGHLAVVVAMDVGGHAHGVADLLALSNARSFERGRTFADIARLLARGGDTDPRTIGIVIADSFALSARTVAAYRATAEYRHLLGQLLYGEAKGREKALGLLIEGFRRRIEPAPNCDVVMRRELEPAIRRRGLISAEEDHRPRNGAAG